MISKWTKFLIQQKYIVNMVVMNISSVENKVVNFIAIENFKGANAKDYNIITLLVLNGVGIVPFWLFTDTTYYDEYMFSIWAFSQ